MGGVDSSRCLLPTRAATAHLIEAHTVYYFIHHGFARFNTDDETANRRTVNLGKKTGFVPEPLFRNWARVFHHGLAVTTAHSREAGYIKANCSRQRCRVLQIRDGPYIFCQGLGYDLGLESLFGIHLFEPPVLFFELLESCHH